MGYNDGSLFMFSFGEFEVIKVHVSQGGKILSITGNIDRLPSHLQDANIPVERVGPKQPRVETSYFKHLKKIGWKPFGAPAPVFKETPSGLKPDGHYHYFTF